MIKKLKYKNEEINYILTRKNVKNINIRIKNKIVYISANNYIPLDYIENLLIEKWSWIQKNLNNKSNNYINETKKSYISGEKFLYLGNYYNLEIISSSLNKVELHDNLKLFTNNNSIITRKGILDKWYLQKIEYVFHRSLNENYKLIENYTNIYSKLKYRKMISRWGSCKMPEGVITLNKHLIKAPIEAIDYVVLHELVHLVYQNHSSDFYTLLEKLMPDWKKKEAILKN